MTNAENPGCHTRSVGQIDLRFLRQRAGELGHEVHVKRRDFPQYDVPPKFYVSCSCGWKFKAAVRSEKNAIRWATFHLGYEVGKHDGKVPQGASVSVPGIVEGIRDAKALR